MGRKPPKPDNRPGPILMWGSLIPCCVAAIVYSTRDGPASAFSPPTDTVSPDRPAFALPPPTDTESPDRVLGEAMVKTLWKPDLEVGRDGTVQPAGTAKANAARSQKIAVRWGIGAVSMFLAGLLLHYLSVIYRRGLRPALVKAARGAGGVKRSISDEVASIRQDANDSTKGEQFGSDGSSKSSE